MKKYIKPTIKVKEIGSENLLQGSLDSINPTTGLDNSPSNGGQNDGSHPVGAKESLWDNFE